MNVLVIVGHPDPAPERFCRALARAYAQGAEAAGHAVRLVDLAGLEVPMLRTQVDFESGTVPPSLAGAAKDLQWAGHVVLVFPLWLGTMPALVKAFLEQVFRPGVAFRYRSKGMPEKLLRAKSIRIVVTMGMPAVMYRWLYFAHGVKGMERNIFRFTGMSPVRTVLVGMAGGTTARARQRWLDRMSGWGRRAL
jgi:putative NADPH-quinone reductase